MKKYKVPVQSLIDHIKTAVDVDPWAKEMAEDLLKLHIPADPATDSLRNIRCPQCNTIVKGYYSQVLKEYCCQACGQKIKSRKE